MAWRDWVRTVEIEPSLLAADFAHLGEQVQYLLNAGARIFHFDVGDGQFVPSVTMGAPVLRSIAPMIQRMGGYIDCHLMTETPAKHFQEFAEAGANSVTFHVEAVDDVSAVLAQAREHGLGAGVAFSPDTEVEVAAAAANLGADICLCMTVVPGYGGQELLEASFERLEKLRGLVDCFVQADGGIHQDNVRQVHDAGADLIVVGTGIFDREDLPRSYRRLVQALA